MLPIGLLLELLLFDLHFIVTFVSVFHLNIKIHYLGIHTEIEDEHIAENMHVFFLLFIFTFFFLVYVNISVYLHP